MTLKWTFTIPALAAGALLVASTMVPTGPADAQGSPAVRKKCGAWAKQQAPSMTPDDAKRRSALFRQCVAKGGKV